MGLKKFVKNQEVSLRARRAKQSLKEQHILLRLLRRFAPRNDTILVLMLLGFSGCAILENLDEISTLGIYSREKDNQHRLVKSINDHYDALTKVIDQKTISDYKDTSAFLHSFGEPILKKDLKDGGQRWLYRYAIYRFAKDKVYVYFDHNGKIIRWERLPCSKFF